MPTRRTTTDRLAPIALWNSLNPDTDAWAQSGEQAVGFVKSTSEQLIGVAHSTDLPQELRDRLKAAAAFACPAPGRLRPAASGISLRPIRISNIWPDSTTLW